MTIFHFPTYVQFQYHTVYIRVVGVLPLTLHNTSHGITCPNTIFMTYPDTIFHLQTYVQLQYHTLYCMVVAMLPPTHPQHVTHGITCPNTTSQKV